LMVPMWHILATYISTGSILYWSCAGAFDAFWYPILILVGAKWNLLHQVLVGCSALCNLIPQLCSNRTHEKLYEPWSGFGKPTLRWLDQCVVWSNRAHMTWELAFGELYLWVMSIYKATGEETFDPVR
jgi:hypothetical protein